MINVYTPYHHCQGHQTVDSNHISSHLGMNIRDFCHYRNQSYQSHCQAQVSGELEWANETKTAMKENSIITTITKKCDLLSEGWRLKDLWILQ